MMKLKKLFALALAGVMTLALLTGCGDKLGDKSDDTLSSWWATSRREADAPAAGR